MGQKPSTTSANFVSVTSGSTGTSSLSRNSANGSGGATRIASSRFMMLNWSTLLGHGLMGKTSSVVVTTQHARPEQPIKFQYSNRKVIQKKQEKNIESAIDGVKIINTVAINNNNNINANNSMLKSTNLNKRERHNLHRRKLRSREKDKIEREHQTRVPPQFGYEIQDIDDFLTKATLDKPANIPVVLAFPSVLYQTRIGGYQAEIALPLGMVVNAVFKNQHWLYVQTPHAEEGYVSYTACLPLGIIPAALDMPSSDSPPHCWEHCSDVFPKPSGNQTDTEKISSYSNNSTSSKSSSILMEDDCCNDDDDDDDDDDDGGGGGGACEIKDSQSLAQVTTRRRRSRGGNKQQHEYNRRQAVSVCGERSVDRLYLRATANNKRLLQLRHANNNNLDSTQQLLNKLQIATTNTGDIIASNNGSTTLDTLLIVRCLQKSLLVPRDHEVVISIESPCAFRCDYQPSIERNGDVNDATAMANVLTVSRGEVVSLLAVARQPCGWFWVRTRGGVEGFIPAAIVGHGFL